MFQGDDLPKAFAVLSTADSSDPNWYPDTAATAHMTADAGNLSCSRLYDGTDRVLVGNGQLLDISHIGSAKLSLGQSKFLLKDLLHVPSIRKNGIPSWVTVVVAAKFAYMVASLFYSFAISGQLHH